jgi:hypothetical protein
LDEVDDFEIEPWHCPICGEEEWTWKDSLDHVIKEHIGEYANKFYKI